MPRKEGGARLQGECSLAYCCVGGEGDIELGLAQGSRIGHSGWPEKR